MRNAGYYWAPNDYTDFTVAGDCYPSTPSLRLRAGRRATRALYKFEGQIEGSYTPAIDAGGDNGGDLQAYHQQRSARTRALTARANFTSSADYTKDPLTGKPLANRIDRFLTSSLTLSHRQPWAASQPVRAAARGPRRDPPPASCRSRRSRSSCRRCRSRSPRARSGASPRAGRAASCRRCRRPTTRSTRGS